MTTSKNDKHMDTWGGSLMSGSGAPSADNIAETFTPSKPMYAPGVNARKMEAKGDIPAKLQQAIKKGVQQITPRCLKENAEIFLSI